VRYRGSRRPHQISQESLGRVVIAVSAESITFSCFSFTQYHEYHL
jgi:hypothetical protein